MAERWTAAPGLTAPGAPKQRTLRDSAEDDLDPQLVSPKANYKPPSPITASDALNGGGYVLSPETPSAVSNDWQLFEVVLHRGGGGFGFSIAGGVDAPHIPDDPAIYVTKVVPNGAADLDGRMQLNDCILRVNQMDVSSVAHNTAVDSLKRAGAQLHLLIRRPVTSLESAECAPGLTFEVLLAKSERGLGFSIAGGAGNDHIPGDSGIFITKVIEGGAAAQDGRIAMGDRLIAVNDVNLDGVRHEEAVAALKATGHEVALVLVKAGPAEIAAMTEAEQRAALAEFGEDTVPAEPRFLGSPESNTTGAEKKKKDKSKKKKAKDK